MSENVECAQKRVQQKRTACKRCDATIIWCRTQRGRFIPLNPLPTDCVGQYLVDGESAYWLSGELTEHLREHGVELFQDHGETCPKGWRISNREAEEQLTDLQNRRKLWKHPRKRAKN
jgi:hypothetical protein